MVKVENGVRVDVVSPLAADFYIIILLKAFPQVQLQVTAPLDKESYISSSGLASQVLCLVIKQGAKLAAFYFKDMMSPSYIPEGH